MLMHKCVFNDVNKARFMFMECNCVRSKLQEGAPSNVNSSPRSSPKAHFTISQPSMLSLT